MKIFIHTMYFLPDFGSAPILMAELASFLAEKGYEVEVLTTFPREKKEKKYQNKIYLKEKMGNYLVKRFWTNSSQTPWGRFLAWSIYSFWTILHALFKVKKEDKLFLRLPPLQLGLTGLFAQKVKGSKVILNLQDIYPDLAIESGILKNPQLIKLAKIFEKWLYQHFDCLTVISQGFKENLKQKGVPERKIKIIPNWADLDFFKPLPKNNKIAKKLGWENKFVITYAGSLTLSSFSALKALFEVALLLRKQKEILFGIVGQGRKKKELIKKVQEFGLSNVHFLPFQPREEVPYLLAASDLLVVPLDITKSQLSLPSKLYNFMAMGKPLLGLAPKDSEITKIIQKSKCGMAISPNNIKEIKEKILTLKKSKDLRETLGKRGREFAEKNFGKEKILNFYQDLISSL